MDGKFKCEDMSRDMIVNSILGLALRSYLWAGLDMPNPMLGSRSEASIGAAADLRPAQNCGTVSSNPMQHQVKAVEYHMRVFVEF